MFQNKEKQHFKVLRVASPYCKYIMSGKVDKTVKGNYHSSKINNGYETFFNMELWFLTSFDNKLVWALNREHLHYLMDYLSADLREKPFSAYTFMKTAKNRKGIVKVIIVNSMKLNIVMK
ncbi:hypothetical protein HCB41_02540 [Listeria welshimeri]|nr:hypothetical protein [Listeria welshimeri]MBC2295542.1 hypothetical protein [Listeria welshimeri]